MATRRTRRGPFKGRSLVAFGLLAFIAITSLVMWRRSVGVATATAMSKSENAKRALISEKTTLERDITDAQSRLRVVAEAQRRLGLHVASDAQSRVLGDSPKVP